jgi:chromosome segregation ATPase
MLSSAPPDAKDVPLVITAAMFEELMLAIRTVDANEEKRYEALKKELMQYSDEQFAAMKQDVKELKQDTKEQFDATKQAVKELKQETKEQFDAMKQDMNNRFDDMNKLLDGLKKQFDAMTRDTEKWLDGMNKDLDITNTMFDELKTRFDAMTRDTNKRFDGMNNRLDEMDKALDDMKDLLTVATIDIRNIKARQTNSVADDNHDLIHIITGPGDTHPPNDIFPNTYGELSTMDNAACKQLLAFYGVVASSEETAKQRLRKFLGAIII